MRFGLCCRFVKEAIKFRRTTAAYLKRQSRTDALDYLAQIAVENARALKAALVYCRSNGIGAFRISSQLLPLKTHPEVGYQMTDLPGYDGIIAAYQSCGAYSREHNIRTSFHPDQFVVLSSPDPGVVNNGIAELTYQAEAAQWVHADVINIHAGGAYGDKGAALKRLKAVIRRLPDDIRTRLTLENDDRTYTPRDLLPVCEALDIPLVYDVHHHRCLPDGLSEEQVTRRAMATWNREPLFHLSSPLNGWQGSQLNRHHDYLNPDDFPPIWRELPITVDIEAKAKELAVKKFITDLKWIKPHNMATA